MIESVDEVIDALGNTGAVASALGVGESTVSSWRARRSIPSTRWLDIADLAKAKRVSGVTIATLAAMHSKRPAEAAEARR